MRKFVTAMVFWLSACAAQPVPAKVLSMEERIDRMEHVLRGLCGVQVVCNESF